MKEETTYHIPVLLKQSVEAMNIRPDGTYVDVTFGGGGHSREILSRLKEGGRLLGFDQDEDAERNIVSDPHFTFVRSNFRYLHNFLRYHGIGQVDAVLADLGVSSHHFDDSERGFSFRFDGVLDMRMNKRAGITAADVVNTYGEEQLADIFYLYGELKNSRKLASAIAKARATAKITTIGGFLNIVKPFFGRQMREERTGQSVSGTAHRGQPRDGSTERNAVCRHRSTKARRPAGGNHLPLSGRPHGEEHHEDRQRGRQSGEGLLRKCADTVTAGQQQSDCPRQNGSGTKPALTKRQTADCRENRTMI